MAVLGEQVRLFGRNLAYPEEAAHPVVYLNPAGSGKGRWLDATVDGRYALAFKWPEDLNPGRWQVRVATGRGIRMSWSAPLSLEVRTPAKSADRVQVRDVKDLRQALSRLAKEDGSNIIYLAAGAFNLHEPLVLPAGVQLVGSGAEQTILRFVRPLSGTKGLVKTPGSFAETIRAPDLQPGRSGPSARAAVLLFDSDSGLSNLSIIGNASTQIGVAIAGTQTKPVHRIRLIGIRIAGLGSEKGTHGQTAAVLARHVQELEVRNSALYGNGPALFLEDVADSAILNNKLTGLGEGVISAREGGVRHCVIEGNRFIEQKGGIAGVRALWISTLFGSSYENYIAHNQGAHFRPPPGTDQNRGEAILLETALSHPYFGHPIRVDSDSVTLPKQGVDWDLLDANLDRRGTPLEHYFVIVLSGRGQGQVRRVTERNRRTLHLERPWRVMPDANSIMVVTELFHRNLIINNEITDAMTGVQLWINGIENIIANNHLENLQREGILLLGNALGRRNPLSSPSGPNRTPIWPFGSQNRSGFNAGIGPSYFNEVHGNTVKNALIGISVAAGDFRTRSGPVTWPISMGNTVHSNRVGDVRTWGIYIGTRHQSGNVKKIPGFSALGDIVEDNFVRNALRAYGEDARTQAAVFRRNVADFWQTLNSKSAGLVLAPEREGRIVIQENNIFKNKAGRLGPTVPGVIRGQ
jgi:nitrous oxidase accessory protein NosD